MIPTKVRRTVYRPTESLREYCGLSPRRAKHIPHSGISAQVLYRAIRAHEMGVPVKPIEPPKPELEQAKQPAAKPAPRRWFRLFPLGKGGVV